MQSRDAGWLLGNLKLTPCCVTYKYYCPPCAWSLFVLAGIQCVFIKAIGQLLGVRKNQNLFSEKMPMLKTWVALWTWTLLIQYIFFSSIRGGIDKTVFCSLHTIPPISPSSSDYKPKKIKVENDREDKKAKKRKQEEDEASGAVCPSVSRGVLCGWHFTSEQFFLGVQSQAT